MTGKQRNDVVILRKLILNNYTVFEGRCEFDFATRGGPKNVIIVGGKNGGGKTSILEAIRLCLYGAQGVGKRPGREYRAFLDSRINRNARRNTPTAKAVIELQFLFESQGKSAEFLIRRTWSADNQGDEESLYISQDGKELSLEKDYWPEFLKLLIPPGVAQFFIFDGEKIQDIAAEEQSNQTIIDGIKALMGLDVFEHLQEDLENYVRGKLRGEGMQTTQADYKKADANLEAARAGFSSAELDLAELEEDLQSYEQQKSDLEKRITRDYGSRLQDRPQLLKEKVTTEEQIKAVNEQFIAHCSDLLPFAMIADRGLQLEQALDAERKTMNWAAAKEATYPQAQRLAELMFGENSMQSSPPLTTGQKEFLFARVLELWESLFVPPPAGMVHSLIHELPSSAEGSVRKTLVESRGEVASHISDLLDRRERLASRLRALELELNRIPAGGDVDQDLFREIANINQSMGRTKERRADLEEKRERFRTEIKECEKKLAEIQELVEVADVARRQVELCKRVKAILREYLERTTRTRISTLQANVESMLQNLARKDDLLSRLEIDPKDFAVTLYNRRHERVRKTELSAGEKEIYAICLLWGLARTSGRKLPIVIDTPLSRLDSDHRRAIVERYYPTASEQVIILSTDTEVDKEYYQLLAPSVERAFLLDYDTQKERTNVRNGYFW